MAFIAAGAKDGLGWNRTRSCARTAEELALSCDKVRGQTSGAVSVSLVMSSRAIWAECLPLDVLGVRQDVCLGAHLHKYGPFAKISDFELVDITGAA